MSGFMMSPMGFVIVLAYSAVILLAVRFLGGSMDMFRYRWWVLTPPVLVLLSLPWVEEAWVTWHFNEACAEAGVKVYRQVEVEGYVDDAYHRSPLLVEPGLHRMRSDSKEFFSNAEYRFVEHILKNGKVERVDDHVEGLLVTVLDRPTAKYALRFGYRPDSISHEEPIGWKLEKLERQVVDSKTGEILGRDVRINRGLPIYEVLWVRYLGPAMKSCPTESQPAFPQSILKPLAPR